MKQLQVNEMEALRGGSWECLGPGLTALGIGLLYSGPAGLLAGVITYSLCSLASTKPLEVNP